MFDLTHEVIIVPFLIAFDGNSANLCYDMSIKAVIQNESFYKVNFQTICTTLSVNLIGFSRLIIDKTAV